MDAPNKSIANHATNTNTRITNYALFPHRQHRKTTSDKTLAQITSGCSSDRPDVTWRIRVGRWEWGDCLGRVHVADPGVSAAGLYGGGRAPNGGLCDFYHDAPEPHPPSHPLVLRPRLHPVNHHVGSARVDPKPNIPHETIGRIYTGANQKNEPNHCASPLETSVPNRSRSPVGRVQYLPYNDGRGPVQQLCRSASLRARGNMHVKMHAIGTSLAATCICATTCLLTYPTLSRNWNWNQRFGTSRLKICCSLLIIGSLLRTIASAGALEHTPPS